MARAPLLQLSNISLTFGGDPVFDGLDLVVQQGDRVALVGRNGSGKSTLMKVMAGLMEADKGTRVLGPGTSVGYMEQEPKMEGFTTLGEFAASELDPMESYKVDMVAEGLKFNPEGLIATASGGERRRAALAKLLAEAPELMLLDEPTNHLDVQAIAWLEEELKTTRTAYVIISHDRAFLNRLTKATLWVDRGQVRRQEEGFEAFEAWRDKLWEEEDEQRHKLNRKIKAEARWAVEGISARRTRNQGRVRALQDLRAEKSSQINRQGTAAMDLEVSEVSGKRVVEAIGVSKSFGDKQILSNFDIKIGRGDRIAFVGPNGVGKTTLLKMLTGEIEPDSGEIKLGTKLDVAVFDQTRSNIREDLTLWEALLSEKNLTVSGRADQIMVRGHPKHVVGYLKEFLFSDSQARAPVSALSGGEKARLLLAKIMAKPSNLLVLDEPTNDLDIETLDLLQELLTDFAGTVLLVSHDRDFIDRVATQTIAMEGDGQATVYPGGWTDYQRQRKATAQKTATTVNMKSKQKGSAKSVEAAPVPKSKLSFTDKHRLEVLPAEIERIESEIAKLGTLMADPKLFTEQPAKFAKATEMLAERQNALDAVEAEWMDLEERNAG
jgi:ATP-binding cassette subfamily F protein uup